MGKLINLINTRFAPQANWYLHLGHLKIILKNIEISKINNWKINLRIDDTNSKKNNKKYKKNIKINIDRINKINEKLFNKIIFYTSNYSYKLFQYIETIKKNLNKNLKKTRKILNGWYKEKKKVLSLFKNKICYRILYKRHYRTYWNWFIYATYDYSHNISDKIENIRISICSEEFKKNRYIYNIILNILYLKNKPLQKEICKIKIKNNVLSKSKMKNLIKKKLIKNSNDKKLLIIKNLSYINLKEVKIKFKNFKNTKYYINYNKNIKLIIKNIPKKKIIIKNKFVLKRNIKVINLFFIKKNNKIKILNLKKNFLLKKTNYLINCYKIINKKKLECKLFLKEYKIKKNIEWNDENLNILNYKKINKNLKVNNMVNEKMEIDKIKILKLKKNKIKLKFFKNIKNNKFLSTSTLYDLNV